MKQSEVLEKNLKCNVIIGLIERKSRFHQSHCAISVQNRTGDFKLTLLTHIEARAPLGCPLPKSVNGDHI